MPAFRMSEDAKLNATVLANGTLSDMPLNVRNTNVQTEWMDTRDFERIFAFVQTAHTTWTDTITTLKLQQATSSAGAGAKDLTTSGAGLNYNTTTDTIAAVDNFAILEARCEDMDQNNNFRYVRLFAASTGNSGNDYLANFFLMLHQASHKKKQQQGAATATTKVYVWTKTTSDQPA